jgi:sulfatase modifying factor 1
MRQSVSKCPLHLVEGEAKILSPLASCQWTYLLVCFFLVGSAEQLLAAEPNLKSRNSLAMEFVRLPSGEYMRGFNGEDRGEHRFHLAHQFSNKQLIKFEQPAHMVVLSQSLDFGVTEVTVGQFSAFVKETGYKTDAEKSAGALGWFPDEKNYVDRFRADPKITWNSPGFEQTEEHPVTCVSWQDANAFCKWLSKKEGATYRLPTEAEWEYAARAGTNTWYSWGENPDAAYDHANGADAALENAFPKTTQFQRAVKLGKGEGDGAVFTANTRSYKPNPWGLYDMHGNVWEWCQDRWAEDAYDSYFDGVPRAEWKAVVVKDPLFSKETGQHKYGDWRVIRGGSWTCAPAALRSSIRTFAEAADATIYTGFRVVKELP